MLRVINFLVSFILKFISHSESNGYRSLNVNLIFIYANNIE